MSRSHLLAPLAFGALLCLAACDNPAKGKPQAEVSAPVTEGAKGATTESDPITPENSKITFVGAKVTGSHEGRFGAFRGTVDLAGDKPENATIKVEIEVASLTADAGPMSDKLTGHLKSPELLDAAQFPKATFTSTSIRAGGDNGATHTITGNLELHGVKKSISFPAKVAISADAISASSEFFIKRKDFNINYPGKPDDLIKDEVVIKLDIKAPRKKG